MIAKRKKKRKCSSKTVIQEHHVTYDPEWTVMVFKGEHFILSHLQWRKKFSKGFLIALHDFIRTHEGVAVNLGEGKTPPQEFAVKPN